MGTGKAVRVHRYGVDPGDLETLLAHRAQVIDAIRARYSGLVETRLIELEDGTYVDTWFWQSGDQMRAAFASLPTIPHAQASMALTTDAVAHNGTIIDQR